MRSTLVPVFCAVILPTLVPETAAAEDEAATEARSPRETARAHANRGLELFEAGDLRAALNAFQEADQAFSAPTIRLMIARCHDRLGQLLDARDVYRSIVDEHLAHYASREFFVAQEAAKRELEAISSRIPALKIIVIAEPLDQISVTIDETPVLIPAGRPFGPPAARSTAEIPVNPGEHRVTLTAPGRATQTRTVTLEDGDAVRIQLSLLAPSPDGQQARKPQRPPPSDAAQGPAGGRYTVPAIAAFGTAGAAAILGGITGMLSIQKTEEIRPLCPQGQCYHDTRSAYEEAQTLATVSTVSFGVGAAAAAAGTALLLWPRAGGRGKEVGLRIAPGFVGVKGEF